MAAKKYTLYVEEEVMKKVEILAKKNLRSRNNYIEFILTELVNKESLTGDEQSISKNNISIPKMPKFK